MTVGEIIQTLGHAFHAIGYAFSSLLILPLIYLFLPNINNLTSFSNAFIRFIDSVSFWVGELTKWLLPILCLLYTSPSPRDKRQPRMPSSA